jgi:hypothetical protein
MIKRKAQVSPNCQDNKCQCSSQSTIIIHFAVAAHEYSNVVGERFSADDSFINVEINLFMSTSMLNGIWARLPATMVAKTVSIVGGGVK